MKNKTSNLKREILSSIQVSFGFSSLFLFAYSTIITSLTVLSSLNVIVVALIFNAIIQAVLFPVANGILTKGLMADMKKWQSGQSTLEDRTKLFKKIHKIPDVKAKETGFYFILETISMTGVYLVVLHLDYRVLIVAIFGCLLSSYISMVLIRNVVSRVCSKYETALVKDGISDAAVIEKRTFGLSFKGDYKNSVTVPIIFTSFVFISTLLMYTLIDTEVPGFTSALTGRHLNNLVLLLAVNFVACIVLIGFFFITIVKENQNVADALENISKEDLFELQLTPTDIEDEISYNLYLTNKIIILFRSLLKNLSNTGKEMLQPSLELSQISEETATTSLEQSAGVREILATMEDTDTQTREIVDKISNVTQIAQDTSGYVESGFLTLQSNLDKMNEITQSNVSTISGIKDLGEKIGNIWGIVNIINDIAAQTRIIAFNAELEASGAGEAGKSFHIVANEIRRLAAGITGSVDQIKDRITEIQHLSDNLIITSESGTEKIKEGRDLTSKLEEKFADIRNSSEITVESAVDIKSHINQQSTAFDQIVATIRQISAGIENFSQSTNTMNQTATQLKNAADKLENLHSTLSKKAETAVEQVPVSAAAN